MQTKIEKLKEINLLLTEAVKKAEAQIFIENCLIEEGKTNKKLIQYNKHKK